MPMRHDGSGFSGSVTVAGAGESDLGILPHLSSRDLFVQAITRAVANAGLELSMVDGIYTANARFQEKETSAAALAEYMGLAPRISITLPVGGIQFVSAIYHAAAVINAGLAETIVLAAADSAYSGLKRGGAVESYADSGAQHPYESGAEPPLYGLYALIAQRHMYEFGTTEEQLAMVSVQMRANALRHPGAQTREPLTVAQVLQSRMISTPYRLLNCSLISDGGAAVVLTSAGRVIQDGRPAVRIRGVGQTHPYLFLSQAADLTRTGCADAGRAAYAMAGVKAADIDLACVYDPYSIGPIMALEALGFCDQGEGGPFVESGAIAPDGIIPVNPHGGLLSYCHPGRPGGLMLVVEAVRQLAGEAPGRQVDDAELAIVHAHSGIASGDVVMILGRA
jgi:acetyl-CoA acetyltransferase